jgi:hypothetical protein
MFCVGSTGDIGSETARVHHSARRRGGSVADLGARAGSMNQPAILFQPARASAITASTFFVTTSQLTIGFASVPAVASAI